MVQLVTCGCGYIGSNDIRYIQETHPEDRIANLVNLDKLTCAGNPATLADLIDSHDQRTSHPGIGPNYDVDRSGRCSSRLRFRVPGNHKGTLTGFFVGIAVNLKEVSE